MDAKLTTFASASEDVDRYNEQQAAAANNAADNQQNGSPNQNNDANAAASNSEGGAGGDAKSTDSAEFQISLGEDSTSQNQEQNNQHQSQQQFNWRDEIKKVDKKELLKELEMEDFAIELNQHIKNGGHAIDYLNAKAIDYSKVSDDALIKSDLQKQYPTATPHQIDLLFSRKYGVESEANDEDKEFAELQLKTDAYNSRQAKITEQQKFKVHETPIASKDEAYEQWKQDRDSQAQNIEQLNNYYSSHEATKKLNESKRVAIDLGEGVAPFNFSVDKPEFITQAFTDGGKIWRKLTSTPQGEPDVAKQQLIALFSFNPQKVLQEIFNYGKSMGVRKELVEEGQNAQRPQAKIVDVDPNAKPVYKTGTYGNATR